jgi:chromosome partitioning protein
MKKIISVYSLKGGCGKTTLSILIAQYLSSKGYKVALLDSDTQQNSTANWAKFSESQIPSYIITDSLKQADIDGINADFIIIDGTPRTDENAKNILLLSDFVLIPVQPSQLGISSLLQPNHLNMLAEVEKNKPSIKIQAVINGVTQHNTKDVLDTKKVLSDYGIQHHASLGLRKAFVIDYDKPFMACKNSRAINELGYLVDTLLEKIKD